MHAMMHPLYLDCSVLHSIVRVRTYSVLRSMSDTALTEQGLWTKLSMPAHVSANIWTNFCAFLEAVTAHMPWWPLAAATAVVAS